MFSHFSPMLQLGRFMAKCPNHEHHSIIAPRLVATTIGGEKRFAAAVARRLQSLGALTRGDRRAASGVDLSDANFDSPLGRRSLRRMYDHIVQESPFLPTGVTVAQLYKDADTQTQQELQLLSTPEVGACARRLQLA